MNFLIYTYGNHQMGMGHVYRMLSLASRLRDDGHEIHFLMPAWEDGTGKVTQNNYNIEKINVNDFENEHAYRKQLDIYCKNSVFDCIIVDALNVSKNIMILFSNYSKLLVSLDNTGSGRLYADILINVLYVTSPRLQSSTEYNGFEHLIIDNNFNQYHKQNKVIERDVRKILISQGGSDTYGIVPKIITELSCLSYNGEFIVLIGPAFKHWQELEYAIESSDLNITVQKDVKDPWKLFYGMDMAITGGGNTLFELLCVGIPCITLTGEGKELETMTRLKDYSLMLGLYNEIQKGKIRDAVADLINDHEKRIEMSAQGKKVIDGAGVKRLVELIYQKIDRMEC